MDRCRGGSEGDRLAAQSAQDRARDAPGSTGGGDIGNAAHELFYGDGGLHPGQSAADAVMDTGPEGRPVLCIRAVEPEIVRVGELPRVAIGRADQR